MKRTLAALLVALMACSAPMTLSAETVTATQAAQYAGSRATVVGIVTQVSRDSRSGNIFLNMGGRFPNHKFYGIVFSRDVAKFSDLSSLQGAEIAIHGRIEMHKGKAQIIVNDPSQITMP